MCVDRVEFQAPLRCRSGGERFNSRRPRRRPVRQAISRAGLLTLCPDASQHTTVKVRCPPAMPIIRSCWRFAHKRSDSRHHPSESLAMMLTCWSSVARQRRRRAPRARSLSLTRAMRIMPIPAWFYAAGAFAVFCPSGRHDLPRFPDGPAACSVFFFFQRFVARGDAAGYARRAGRLAGRGRGPTAVYSGARVWLRQHVLAGTSAGATVAE